MHPFITGVFRMCKLSNCKPIYVNWSFAREQNTLSLKEADSVRQNLAEMLVLFAAGSNVFCFTSACYIQLSFFLHFSHSILRGLFIL